MAATLSGARECCSFASELVRNKSPLESTMLLHRLRFLLKRAISLLSFEGKVSFGDILTSFSILISIAALLFSMHQDHQQREREKVDKIRTAAAETLVKFEQWRQLSRLFFQDIRSPFVQTSKKFAESYNATEARDFLWSELDDAHSRYFDRLSNENIATSYVNLYGYHDYGGKLSQATMKELGNYEIAMFNSLQTPL